ncbi:MAG: 3-dehydroquinate dehydratase [Micavibrio aeruginosavorus]|uniref:3-dehydroquinate dehydratase n=1 Tax=Micavibrio aeruginosavorus TaxID=349221 RepID=A0A2W4ZXU7_9BACT|nr:MAG: 3-dehydroquinate dehydratase [Micavibrio aeruginosavorus]
MPRQRTRQQQTKPLSKRKVLIINGPNLNMLGVREPHIYGSQTLDDIRVLCEGAAKPLSLEIDFRQSNFEGEIVTWIQDERLNITALIINAGAYTHTSLAIHDALKLLDVPVIEVHLSDPEKRESFRHFSYISPIAAKIIKGKGSAGYVEAIEGLSTLG